MDKEKRLFVQRERDRAREFLKNTDRERESACLRKRVREGGSFGQMDQNPTNW